MREREEGRGVIRERGGERTCQGVCSYGILKYLRGYITIHSKTVLISMKRKVFIHLEIYIHP